MKQVLLPIFLFLSFTFNLTAQWDKYPIISNEFKDTEIPLWGDINGDGIEDLVGYDKDVKAIFWRENNGDGMEKPKAIATDIALYKSTFRVLDWENDGDMDIIGHLDRDIGAPGNTLYFQLFLNNGNGTFIEAEIPVPTEQYYPDVIFFSDIDNDGAQDLVVEHGGDFHIYINEAGVYNYKSRIDGRLSDQIYSIDLKQDGRNKIIHAKDDFSIDIYEYANNELTLSHTRSTPYPGDQLNSFKYPLAFDDLDNDGDLDITRNILDLEIIVVIDVGQIIPRKNYFYQYLQNSDGTFETTRFYTSILDGGAPHTPVKNKIDNTVNYYVYDDGLKTFTFNNGRFELSASTNEGIPENFSGNLAAQCIYPNLGEQMYSVTRNGLFYEVDVAFLSLIPEETFSWQGCLNCSPIEFFDDFEFSDLDGDGDLDIIVSSPKNDNQVIWFENFQEGCHFDNANVALVQHAFENSEILTVEAADFDNDGDNDIVIMFGNVSANLYILENDGAGNFGTPNYVTNIPHAIDLHAEDLYNDGFAEIIIHTGEFSFTTQDPTTFSTTILNNQNGIENFSTTRIQNSTDAGQIEFEDMDNDGDLDMIVYNEDSLFDNVVIYDNNGSEMVQTQIHEDFLDMFAIDIFDVNEDGFPEIMGYHDGLSNNNISTVYYYNNLQGTIDWNSPDFLFEDIDRHRHYGIHNPDGTFGFLGAEGFLLSNSNLVFYSPNGDAETLDLNSPVLYKTADLNNDGFDDIINVNSRGSFDFYTQGSISCTPECITDTEGFMFFQDCGGVEFFVIRTEEGEILDPYFADGVQFVIQDGIYVEFSFVDLGIATPCESARTVELQCIEQVLHVPEFSDYEWLPALIENAENCCEIERIESYYDIDNRYVYVVPSETCPEFREALFNENGELLCVEPDVFIGQCIAEFSLDSLTQKNLYECNTVSNEEAFDDNNIQLFPNPAFDELIIETKVLGKLKIYDAQGKCVQLFDHIPSSLNISDLTEGVYILSFGYNDQVVTKRVVKM